MLRIVAAIGAVLLVALILVVDTAAEGQLPMLDAASGIVMLAVGVAAVVGIGYGFRVMTRKGLGWLGRLISPVLVGFSGQALVLAVEYDNVHRFPDGTATGAGQLAMFGAFTGVVAGLVGVWITWLSRPRRSAESLENHPAEPPLWGVPLPGVEPLRVLPVKGAGAVGLSGNGRYLAVSLPQGRKGVLRVWDVDAGSVLWERTIGTAAGGALAVSPDGSLVAVGGSGYRVLLLGVAAGEDRGSISHIYPEWEAVAFGPHSRGLAVSNDDGRVRIYDLVARGRPQRLGKVGSSLTALCFSPRGDVIVAGSVNGKIVAWDVATSAHRLKVEHGTQIHSLSFGADWTSLASAADDGACRIWDLSTGQQATVFQHGRGANLAALHPHQSVLATAGDDNNVLIWNTNSGQPQTRMPHDLPILYLTADLQGDRLATVTNQHVRIWEWPNSGSLT